MSPRHSRPNIVTLGASKSRIDFSRVVPSCLCVYVSLMKLTEDRKDGAAEADLA